MPATIPAEGTMLESSPDGTTWTEVTGIESLTPPGGEREIVERPDLQSTFKKKRASRVKDQTDCEFTIGLDPNDTGHQALLAAHDNTTVLQWRLTFFDGLTTSATWTWSGILSKVEHGELEEASDLTAECAVTLTTAITRIAGTP